MPPDTEPGVIATGSFTRFAVPFRYSLQRSSKREPAPTYQPIDTATGDAFRDRRAYLNGETASVLFERSRWFRLEPLVAGEKTLVVEGRHLRMRLLSPVVVLFEFSVATEPGGRRNPLQIGFLLRDAEFQPVNGGEIVHLDDVLWFNEVFRYLTRPYPGKETERRLIRDGDFEGDVREMFASTWDWCLSHPVETGGDVFLLNPAQATSPSQASRWYFSRNASALSPASVIADDRGWATYPDERAYVWTCVRTSRLLPTANGNAPLQRPETSGYWVKLLNVDAPGESAGDAGRPSAFERAWARKRTYYRWAERGIYYGFSEHGGALLALESMTPREFIFSHFRTIYFDQVLLLLYLRATAFRFSERLAEVAALVAQRAASPADIDACQSLRLKFLTFTTMYRYPLLSYQQQGIEMYSIARRVMDINDFVRELDDQMAALDATLGAQQQQQLAAASKDLAEQQKNLAADSVLLAKVAAALTAATAVGLAVQLGLAFVDWRISLHADWSFFGWAGLFLVVLVIAAALGFWLAGWQATKLRVSNPGKQTPGD